jgi:hypothetical protein
VAGHNRKGAAAEIGARPVEGVEAQAILAALAGLLVRTVALEAVVGKDRPDVAVEIGRIRAPQSAGKGREHDCTEG